MKFTQPSVEPDWDAHGCLTPAGYAFNEAVGACTRSWEFTDPVYQRAARIAVESSDSAHGLHVLAINPQDCQGCFLVHVSEKMQKNVTIHLENWIVAEKEIAGRITEQGLVTNYDECVRAGNAVMESYPRQCRAENGETFVEDIGNELEKQEIIRIESPRPNQKITSPLSIQGEARGPWFFEGSFPLQLVDRDDTVLVEHFATADAEWMTEEFVPFTAEIEFETPEFGDKGKLFLLKDNPSGLPEHDDVLEVPIRFR